VRGASVAAPEKIFLCAPWVCGDVLRRSSVCSVPLWRRPEKIRWVLRASVAAPEKILWVLRASYVAAPEKILCVLRASVAAPEKIL
jgi:hypothetical protein